MNYYNQLDRIRDIELELEDAYAELEEDLLDNTEDSDISEFIKLMFEECNHIEQFRYVLDAFISFNFYELKVGDELPENILDECRLDTMVQFEFKFRSENGEEYGFLNIEFDQDHIITNIVSGMY